MKQVNGVISLQEVTEEESEPQAEVEDTETVEDAPVEPPAPVVEEMHVEDYVMLHEGAILWYIVVIYLSIEASVMLLLALIIFIKMRLKVDTLSWDISSWFLEMRSADWYKKKFEDIKNQKTTDEEDPEQMNKDDEQKLREEYAESFRTANNSMYTTDNFKRL